MLRHVTGPKLVVHGRSKPTFQQIGLGVLELAEAQGVPKAQGRCHTMLLVEVEFPLRGCLQE